MSKSNSPDRITTCFGNVLHAKRLGKGKYTLVTGVGCRYGLVVRRSKDWYGEVRNNDVLFTNACASTMLDVLVKLEQNAKTTEKRFVEYSKEAARAEWGFWIDNLNKDLAKYAREWN